MAVVEGNHIRVDRTCPPRKKQKGESAMLYDNKRTVFVGNLPFDVKDEELYQLFCGKSDLESNVEAVRVIRNSHLNVGKGIAYVLLKTREAADFVIRKQNLMLRDQQLRIFHAKTPSKQPYSSPAQAPNTTAKKVALGKAFYQALRPNKSDIQKKVHGGEKRKERLVKRPSFAARKAKANSHMDAAPSKQAAGIKRKFDAHTPDSSLGHKKFKRDR